MPLEKRVWEVMESKFVTIKPESTIKEAIEVLTKSMKENPVLLGLVVTGDNDRYMGIVTIKEILQHMTGLFDSSCREGQGESILRLFSDRCRVDADLKVTDIMRGERVQISPKQTLPEALKEIMEDEVRMMPVVDGNRVIGVLYIQDLFLVMKELLKA